MPFTNQKISTSYARQLALNYRSLKLGKQLKIDETQGVWFSRDTILQALNVVDPNPNNLVQGLRIYFAAYEEGDIQPDVTKKGKLTVVLVQTSLVTTATGTVTIKDILDDPNAKPGYPRDQYNDGQICPPPACDADGLLNF